jgi:hypothetical protein
MSEDKKVPWERNVLIMVFLGWMGWISLSVVALASSQRQNEAQWDAINELREADKVLVERIGILEGQTKALLGREGNP